MLQPTPVSAKPTANSFHARRRRSASSAETSRTKATKFGPGGRCRSTRLPSAAKIRSTGRAGPGSTSTEASCARQAARTSPATGSSAKVEYSVLAPTGEATSTRQRSCARAAMVCSALALRWAGLSFGRARAGPATPGTISPIAPMFVVMIWRRRRSVSWVRLALSCRWKATSRTVVVAASRPKFQARMRQRMEWKTMAQPAAGIS